MDTKAFQVIVTVTISLCVVGIIAAAYNLIRYRRIANYNKSEWTNDAKDYVRSAEKMSMITLAIFGLSIIVVVAILVMNLNKSSCLDMDRGAVKPDIGTAKDLADLFK